MIWFWGATLLGWLIVFLVVHRGWMRYRPVAAMEPDRSISLSIVICARNEAESIESCLQSILDQEFLPDSAEVILVDDHSTDATFERASDFMNEQDRVRFMMLSLEEGEGKKAALRLGLEHATGEIIVQTDADCCYEKHAFGHLLGALLETDTQVVFGPVFYRWNSFFTRLLATENLNNQCVTQAFVAKGRPIMANGANMVFRRSQLEPYMTTLNSRISSGDDVFFAQSLSNKAIVCLRDEKAAVVTRPPKTFGELINQRLRWSAKSKHYTSGTAKWFASFIWLLNGAFVLLYLSPIIFPLWFFWVVLLILIKTWMEFMFHRYWFQFFGVRHRVIDALALSLTYPFYVTFIGLAAVLGVGFQWKERFYRA